MHKPVQGLQAFRFTKDFGRQTLPVDRAIRVKNALSELPDHIRVGFPARKQDLVAQLVGFNQVTAQGGESLSDKTFTASQATRQTYF